MLFSFRLELVILLLFFLSNIPGPDFQLKPSAFFLPFSLMSEPMLIYKFNSL